MLQVKFVKAYVSHVENIVNPKVSNSLMSMEPRQCWVLRIDWHAMTIKCYLFL